MSTHQLDSDDPQALVDVMKDLTKLADELKNEMSSLDGFILILSSDRDEEDAVVQAATRLMEQQTKRAVLLHQILNQLTKSMSIEPAS